MWDEHKQYRSQNPRRIYYLRTNVTRERMTNGKRYPIGEVFCRTRKGGRGNGSGAIRTQQVWLESNQWSGNFIQ